MGVYDGGEMCERCGEEGHTSWSCKAAFKFTAPSKVVDSQSTAEAHQGRQQSQLSSPLGFVFAPPSQIWSTAEVETPIKGTSSCTEDAESGTGATQELYTPQSSTNTVESKGPAEIVEEMIKVMKHPPKDDTETDNMLSGGSDSESAIGEGDGQDNMSSVESDIESDMEAVSGTAKRPASPVTSPRAKLKRDMEEIESVVKQRPAVVKFLQDEVECDEGSIKCVQTDNDGSLIVTFESVDYVEHILSLGTLTINGYPVVVTNVDARRKYVKVYYLPYEVSNREVHVALGEFGHVYHIRRDMMMNHPEIETGLLNATEAKIIPFITINDFQKKHSSCYECSKCMYTAKTAAIDRWMCFEIHHGFLPLGNHDTPIKFSMIMSLWQYVISKRQKPVKNFKTHPAENTGIDDITERLFI
ncbi:hypothetical protein QZH41_007001 [Actinostola sp. cb2023]|nr:hypothetical protein QZH41_007001 [Actinostola sp. cb2023]